MNQASAIRMKQPANNVSLRMCFGILCILSIAHFISIHTYCIDRDSINYDVEANTPKIWFQQPSLDASVSIEPPVYTNGLSCSFSNMALMYVAIDVLPYEGTKKAPVFAWALNTLAEHGSFCGNVVIITNTQELVEQLWADVVHEHQGKVLPSVHIVQHVPDSITGNQRMQAKLVKTKLFEYLPPNISSSIQVAAYLDSDVLITQPFQKHAESFLGKNFTLSMFQEMTRVTKSRPVFEGWHSGVMYMTRRAIPCMKEWGIAIASGNHPRDQQAFMQCPLCTSAVDPILPKEDLICGPDMENPLHVGGCASFPAYIHYTSTQRAKAFTKNETHDAHELFLRHVGGIPERYLKIPN